MDGAVALQLADSRASRRGSGPLRWGAKGNVPAKEARLPGKDYPLVRRKSMVHGPLGVDPRHVFNKLACGLSDAAAIDKATDGQSEQELFQIAQGTRKSLYRTEPGGVT
jgi:hypothetical protein